MGKETLEHTPESALASLQDELARIDAKSCPQYNLDATFAASVVFDAIKSTSFLSPMFGKMPTLDVKAIERLPVFANALIHANALVIAHSPQSSTFDGDAVVAREVREDMFGVCDRLVRKNRLDADVVARIRAGQGNRDLIEDVVSLRVVLLPFEGGPIDKADLDLAASIAARLTHSLAQHNGDDPELGPLLDQRRKVASLLVNAYNELLAAASFLRRVEKDTASLVPSIYVQGTKTKRGDEVTPVEPAAPSRPNVLAVESTKRGPNEPSDNPFEDSK